MNEKAKILFNNKKQMHRYGAFAKYLPVFYERVSAMFPAYADEIADRMSDINVQYKPTLTSSAVGSQNQAGLTFRKFHKDRMFRGIRLVNGAEPILVDRNVLLPLFDDDFAHGAFNRELKYNSGVEEYRNRQVFYHEMLHAIAGVSRYEGYSSQVGNAIIFGNASQWEIVPDGEREFYKSNSTSVMVEEGIVEDWATDIALNEIDNEYTRSLDYAHIMVYPMASNFVSMWNLASSNQLRREFLSGVGDGSEISKATQEFKSKFIDLYKSFNWNMQGQKQLPNNYDLDKISQSYVDLINYCNNQFFATPHSDSAVHKFKSNLNYIMSCQPLLKDIEKITDKENTENYEKMQQELCSKILSQLGVSQSKLQDNSKQKLTLQQFDVNSRLAGSLREVGALRPTFRANNGEFGTQSNAPMLERDKD